MAALSQDFLSKFIACRGDSGQSAVGSGSTALAEIGCDEGGDRSAQCDLVEEAQGQDIYLANFGPGSGDTPPRRVNTIVAGNQSEPKVARNAAGNFAIAWRSDNPPAIVTRVFSADGTPASSDVILATSEDFQANVEMVVKVLNACSFGERFWAFAGGLTNVRVTLRVDDLASGHSKSYVNFGGEKFQPIQDTAAFDTCSASP